MRQQQERGACKGRLQACRARQGLRHTTGRACRQPPASLPSHLAGRDKQIVDEGLSRQRAAAAATAAAGAARQQRYRLEGSLEGAVQPLAVVELRVGGGEPTSGAPAVGIVSGREQGVWESSAARLGLRARAGSLHQRASAQHGAAQHSTAAAAAQRGAPAQEHHR